MLRYEREIEELLAELEVRERCHRRALPPSSRLPRCRLDALRRLSPPARETDTGVPLVGVLLLLAGVFLGGTFGQWAILIGAALPTIAAARFRLTPRVIRSPMNNELYRVPQRRY